MWHLPESGIEPMFPALAGGFLTSELPEKPVFFCLFVLMTDINKLAQTVPCLSQTLAQEYLSLAS